MRAPGGAPSGVVVERKIWSTGTPALSRATLSWLSAESTTLTPLRSRVSPPPTGTRICHRLSARAGPESSGARSGSKGTSGCEYS